MIFSKSCAILRKSIKDIINIVYYFKKLYTIIDWLGEIL
ncbi:hypothetical protein M092_1220 [Parabacteroides distasonis str. 3776 D15 iv]|uniref:Uncharacterized protein n=1 Tax=Parabacteroides distasonis str. 3776 D15 i TaxID=1339342 RepID=A0AB34LIE4_PARDI|nr:hypothetical protein M091_4580 [Parabacteroides distasonis str. 3776 D15 i]KDS51162.1 hypothetical protein M090_2389 [Parabacteroides distasonis str. 3776 Po2 i]KDS72465.1 hypothetical protein M092_1220 [Parabacteroides distasonis str. 3776 D15 iv]